MVPFLQQFNENTADKDLVEKLKSESEGILAWAVQGFQKYQADGLGMPEVVQKATEQNREEADPITEFLSLCIISPEASVSARDLWDEYCFFVANNHESEQLSRREFTRRLISKGFKKVRRGHNRTWVWLGIGIKQTGDVRKPLAA